MKVVGVPLWKSPARLTFHFAPVQLLPNASVCCCSQLRDCHSPSTFLLGFGERQAHPARKAAFGLAPQRELDAARARFGRIDADAVGRPFGNQLDRVEQVFESRPQIAVVLVVDIDAQ